MSTAEKNVDIAGSESQTPVTETTADSVQQSDTPGIETPQEEQPYRLTVKAPNGAQVPVLATAQETVQDIKQVVSETPSTVEYSCFSLQYNGQRLNDFSELGELDLELECQLDLIEEEYTEREARLHVSRLRDLLTSTVTASADVAGVDAGASVFDTIKHPEGVADAVQTDLESTESKSDSTKKTKKKQKEKEKQVETPKDNEVSSHAFQGFEFESVPQFDVLSAEKALKQLRLPQCVRQLVLSGWNPVPRHRHLQGDLLYLQVVTLENQTFQITSSRNGFFVNASSSTRFNPAQYSEAYAGQPGVRGSEFYCAHSLVTLLRRISPKFAQSFDQLQAEMAKHEPVEVLPFATSEQAATPWLVRNNASQEYDSGRTQDMLRQGAQGDALRDWNEELQSIRELPRSSLSERVLRDRQLHKWHAEFGEAAIRGAMAVVEGEMLALNPSDPQEQHMYLRDNIFYSKGFDGRETFAELGGDAAAHVATGKDITGVRLLNQLDVEGLNTLGSVVVDYRGVRVVAQSVVPGIFRRQETTQIVYGSIDSGNTVGSDAEFHKLVEPVAKALHFGEHTVKDAEGAEHKLFTSADVKGLTGTDGRKYLLDLYRMTPVDVEFLENECKGSSYPHKLVLLRPELIDIYWENRVRKAVQEYAVEKAKKPSEETKDESESQQDAKLTKDALAGFEFTLEFSPDAFTALQAKDSGEELANAVRDASKFLREVSVPALAQDLAAYTTSPLSGDALVTAMHQRGINMRYLGQIANLLPADVESARNVRRLVIFEMIARATKHILRKLFRQIPAHLHMEAFALVANGLVGTRYCADPTEYLSAAARAIPALADLKPEHLAAEVCSQIQQRFRFELDANFADSLVKGSERILLREICIKSGVQLALRDYKFERPDEAAVYAAAVASMGTQRLSKPAKRAVRARVEAEMARKLSIEVSDVVNFVAITKAGVQSASFADEAFEAGRVSLEQGQKALGLELLLESLALHEQTFGVLHPESARCYAVVSLAHYDAGEHDLAAEFMTRAVVVSERTHARGNTLLALRLMRRAMDLWRLINSPDHPDLATAHNNIGVMLQSLRLHDDALRFFRSCLDIRRHLLGNEHILVANAQHSLAKALAITGDFKEAVQVERDAHAFFNSRFGAEDPRTRETAEWLSELTFNAVRSAKLSRAAQEKIRDIASAAANLVPVDRENSSEAKNAKGDLPIDELLKFITGSSSSKPKPKPGRRAKGPKGSRR
ncbi:clustered mitochondria-domain-containing protein [Coemansia mojavensis]|nr:clustered mitochondria-domain-containing protein [Coemansia mojavensis]